MGGSIPMGNALKQYPQVIYLPVIADENFCMETFENRRLRLKQLIDVTCDGKITTFAGRIKRSDSYASRMLYPASKKGHKRIGDDMMLVIEDEFHLSRAWLDLPLGEQLPEKEPPGFLGAMEPLAIYATGTPKRIGTGKKPLVPWPFERVTPKQYSALKSVQRTVIEDTILAFAESEAGDQTKSDDALGKKHASG